LSQADGTGRASADKKDMRKDEKFPKGRFLKTDT
jgi:hypothetical protein